MCRPPPSASLRQQATLIVRGIGSASALALLALGGAVGLFAGSDATPAVIWLSGLGMNTFAGWLDTWARANLTHILGEGSNDTEHLLVQIARDLDAQMARDTSLTIETATLVKRTQAITVVLDALQGQSAAQQALLQALLDSTRSTGAQNAQLHALTFQAVLAQAAELRTVVQQSDRVLYGLLQQLLERVAAQTQTYQHEQAIDGITGVAIAGNNYGTIINNPQPLPPVEPPNVQSILDGLPIDAVPDPAPLPTPHRMPLRHNPRFVGRAENLLVLAATIKYGRAVAITTGIGGIGKTQLASEFAHRYGQFFAGGVFWLSFANPADIDNEIAACGGAGALGIYTDADKRTLDEQVELVYQAWEQPIPRLLIFDNCNDDTEAGTAEKQLLERLPKSGECRILATSRRDLWHDAQISTHALGTLPRSASIALLQGHCSSLAQIEANLIADLLGDLPLALSLAGSYLETYRHEVFGQPRTYLKNLKQALLNHRSLQGAGTAPSPTDHERDVHATFDLSFQRLNPNEPVDALAITALACATHLVPGEPFPYRLLLMTLGEDTEDETIAASRADAIHRLMSLGLIERAEEGHLRIHRLISAFAQAVVPDDMAEARVEEILVDIGNKMVDGGGATLSASLIVHIRYAQMHADKRSDIRAADLATVLGRIEENLTNSLAARTLYERALTIKEQVLGSHHPNIITNLNSLANLLYTQNDLTGARSLYERALAIREHIFEPRQLDTVTSLDNLADLLRTQGDLSGAQEFYERALDIRKQILGPRHPDTATNLDNLGMLMFIRGNLAGARLHYERALAIREQTLGSLHPHTAASLNNFGILLRAEGDLVGARTFHERALEIREQVLGPQHPDTATSLNNLGALSQDLNNLVEARPYYERALAIREQVLGSLHPHTATSMNNLANLLHSQGNLLEAKPIYERALVIFEVRLGADHPHTRAIRENLAVLVTQIDHS